MKRILLIVVSIVSSLLIAEISLSRLRPQAVYTRMSIASQGCSAPDPNLYVVPKAGNRCRHMTTDYEISTPVNNQGFIGEPDTAPEVKPGTHRIAFIGDSYTFGQGVPVDSSYPAFTGTILRTHGIHTDVLNASHIGTGTDWYYLRLKHAVLPYKPEVTVIGIYLGNDLSDVSYFRRTRVDDQSLPISIDSPNEYLDTDGTRKSTATPMRYRIPMLHNSHLFIALATLLFGRNTLTNQPIFTSNPCMLSTECQQTKEIIAGIMPVLSGMQSIVSAYGGKLLIVLIPWELQLPKHVLQLSYVNFYATDENRRAVSAQFADALAGTGIPYVDLLPVFEEYTGTEPLFYPVDRHWTVAGHRLAAEAIAPVLQKLITKTSPPQASGTE